MPTTTSRLGLPYPVGTDPANVPGDMGNLANALDAGDNASWAGVVVFDQPGVVGSVPVSPIKGTLYPVNSSPPYLLYYTGESGSGSSTVPAGWRLVGGPGTNVSNITNANPGNSAGVGAQPVWARLDHQHSTPPWGTSGQLSNVVVGAGADGGSLIAYARADHEHAFPNQAATQATNDNSTAIATDQFVQTAKQTISLYGVGGNVFPGGGPPARLTGNFLMQAGSANLVTNGIGALTFNFPVAFPTGIMSLTVTATNGDNVGFAVVNNGAVSVASFEALFYQPGGAAAGNVNVVFSWIAIGW